MVPVDLDVPYEPARPRAAGGFQPGPIPVAELRCFERRLAIVVANLVQRRRHVLAEARTKRTAYSRAIRHARADSLAELANSLLPMVPRHQRPLQLELALGAA